MTAETLAVLMAADGTLEETDLLSLHPVFQYAPMVPCPGTRHH